MKCSRIPLLCLMLSGCAPAVGGPIEDARAAFALAASPKTTACTCVTGGVCTCGDVCGCGAQVASDNSQHRYDQAYERALAAGKPLLVFVRQNPFGYAGAFTCRVEYFPDFEPLSGVVIAKPSDDGKKLWRVADLGVNATGADVKRALSRCPECEIANAATAGGCASCSGGGCASGGCSSGACYGGGCSSGGNGAGGCASGGCGSCGRGRGFFGRRR